MADREKGGGSLLSEGEDCRPTRLHRFQDWYVRSIRAAIPLTDTTQALARKRGEERFRKKKAIKREQGGNKPRRGCSFNQ